MQPTKRRFRRPKRWEEPFGEEPLSSREVDRVLSRAPFSEINPQLFPPNLPLAEILRNDTRIVRTITGDVLMRAGDFGTSSFFVLGGRVRVLPGTSPDAIAGGIHGSFAPKQRSLLQSLSGFWRRGEIPEVRDYDRSPEDERVLREGPFLVDVEAVLESKAGVTLSPGDFFGELGALARTPRTATVFAETEGALLELRWQALRELYLRVEAIRDRIDGLYRDDALAEYFRSAPLFAHLDEHQLQRVADETIFESFGERDWSASYKRDKQQGTEHAIASEPIVAEEGHYPNGLLMIRSGFARESVRVGEGQRTLRYLTRGQMFGLEEIAESWQGKSPAPYRHSLRAIGYLDTLLVPSHVLKQLVLPGAPPGLLVPAGGEARVSSTTPSRAAAELESQIGPIVDGRYINGTATMMIDLNRCTHCDDCVRACAATHDGNPRFVRHGEQIGHFMIANACMHCADPVCMVGCPTGAIQRLSLAGQVTINDRTCIGCASCANNCPYDNIRMVEARAPDGVIMIDSESNTPILKATKCDLCVDQRVGPACQNACPHDALKRVEARDFPTLQELLIR